MHVHSDLRRMLGTTDPAMITPEAAAAAGVSVPGFHYIGLFAGGTKPKPFQRRRANLSADVPDGEPTIAAFAYSAYSAYKPHAHSQCNLLLSCPLNPCHSC